MSEPPGGRRGDTGVVAHRADRIFGSVINGLLILTAPLMTGNKVRQIQQKLKSAGFDPGIIDGQFGPHTQAAVVAFQLSEGLIPDGEVGAKTAAALGIQL